MRRGLYGLLLVGLVVLALAASRAPLTEYVHYLRYRRDLRALSHTHPNLVSIPALEKKSPSSSHPAVPYEALDPTRSAKPVLLEADVHQPLREEYIAPVDESVEQRHGWAARISRVLHRKHPVSQNKHIYFRRTFDVQAVLPDERLYIAGPTSVSVYVNEHLAGHAEAQEATSLSVFTFPVGEFLHPGANVVAVEAAGKPNFQNASAAGSGLESAPDTFLVLKIVPQNAGKEPALVISDPNWRSTSRTESNWFATKFDDSRWAQVRSLGPIEGRKDYFRWNEDAGMYAWPGYDGISPYLAHFKLSPANVEELHDGAGKIELIAGKKNPASDLGLCVDLSTGSESERDKPWIVLDFGREVAGRIELESGSDQAEEVLVRYGESKPELKNAPYLKTSRVVIAPHQMAYGPKSGFRYASVQFTQGKHSCYRHIALDGIVYPVNYKGSFTSSDEMLNRIWESGAYTAHLAMQDDVWDGPKRDRGPWAGDFQVEARTISDVFDDRFLLESTLEAMIGAAPVRRHVNGVPEYSALWVTAEHDYYLHAGAQEQLERIQERLTGLLALMAKEVDGHGLYMDRSRSWQFVDWSPGLFGGGAELMRATQFEYIQAFQDGADLLRALGDGATANRYEQLSQRMRSAAGEYLLSDKNFGDRLQTNAFAILSGAADAQRTRDIWQSTLSHVGKAEDPNLPVTPYCTYYVISAMAEAGHGREALDWVRAYWGGMLDRGATSFWEGFDVSWPAGKDFHASLQADNKSGYYVSLAHGWSSGVTAWLMDYILGVRSRGAGMAKIEIRPDLMGLEWAKGTLPTPRGLLTISIKQQPTELIEMDLPPSTEATIFVPLTGKEKKVEIDGRAERFTTEASGSTAILKIDKAGHHVIRSL